MNRFLTSLVAFAGCLPTAQAETNKEVIAAAQAARAAVEKLEVSPSEIPVFACVDTKTGKESPAILVAHETGPLAVYISGPRGSHRAVFAGNELQHELLKRPVSLEEKYSEVMGFRADRIEGTPGPRWMFHMLPLDADVISDGDPLLVKSSSGWKPISAALEYGDPVLSPNDFSTADVLFKPEVVSGISEGAPVVLAETGHLVGLITFSGHLLKMRRIRELLGAPREIPPQNAEILWGFGRPDLDPQELATLVHGIFPPEALVFELGKPAADIFKNHESSLSGVPFKRRGFTTSRRSGSGYWMGQFSVTSNRSGITEIDFLGGYLPYEKDRLTRLYQFYFKVFGVPDELSVLEDEFQGKNRIRSVASAWYREAATVFLYTAHAPEDGLFVAAHLEPPSKRLGVARYTNFEKISNPSVRAVPTIKRWMDETDSFEKQLTEQTLSSPSRR